MGGGLLGTLLQMIMVYGVAPLIAGQSMDVAAITGHACAPSLLAHLLSGSVIFPLGYVWLSSRAFSRSPVLQGMLWAGLIWCVAEVIMAPMLGVEIFSTALGGLPAALRAARVPHLWRHSRQHCRRSTARGQVCIARLMSETLPLNRIYLGKGIRLTGGQPALLASEIGFKSSPEN